MTMDSPPLKATEIAEETSMKIYCKNIFSNARNPLKAKIEIHVGTILRHDEWLKQVGSVSNYLQDNPHTREYPNTTNGPNSIIVGFGVMSTAWANLHAMGIRLSIASGLNIGYKAGDIVLESGGGYDGAGVIFYNDREEEQEVIHISTIFSQGFLIPRTK